MAPAARTVVVTGDVKIDWLLLSQAPKQNDDGDVLVFDPARRKVTGANATPA